MTSYQGKFFQTFATTTIDVRELQIELLKKGVWCDWFMFPSNYPWTLAGIENQSRDFIIHYTLTEASAEI